MSGRKLAAITGGSGFLGAQVVAKLRGAGWRVRVLLRQPMDGAMDAVPGSLEDEGSLRRLVAGVGLVVHVAGCTHARSAAQFRAVNVEGAKRLGRAMRFAAGDARLVAVSSLAAREPHLSPYAASKCEGETALLNEARSDDWVVLRPSALYGPGDRATLPLFRAALLPVLPIPRLQSARLALLHVDDAAAAVLAAAQSSIHGACWEIGAGAFTWTEIGREVAKAMGRDPALMTIPKPVLAVALGLARGLAAGASPMASPGKLAELLHADWTCGADRLPPDTLWQPTIGLGKGIGDTASWYRLHGWL